MALLDDIGATPTFWKDVDNLFRRDVSGGIALPVEQEAVKQSIENIILTSKMTRPMIRNFGSDLERFLWKPLTDTTKTLLISTLNKEISTWDNRPQIQNIQVEENADGNGFEVFLQVLVPKNNSSFVMSVSL
jgi:phage baseplate assembly protein W